MVSTTISFFIFVQEATLAVAAFSKKESDKHSGQNNTRTTSRNHLARKLVHGVYGQLFGRIILFLGRPPDQFLQSFNSISLGFIFLLFLEMAG